MILKKGYYWSVWVLIFCLFFQTTVFGETKEPNVVARTAILIDFDTGRVLWEKGANDQRAMASTTKIMTCLLALEQGNLEDEVTVSKRAAGAPPVKQNIRSGEKFILKDLLYALMMESANDVAVAIAEHIGGSVEAFCDRMTKKAKEIGANHTSYKTPNGLDADGHYSTAYDLALITRYALNNPDFVEIINTKEKTISSVGNNKRSFYLANTNRFLSEYAGALGVKTGYTGQAGYCFVGAAKQEDLQLISVVLGSNWPPDKNQKWIDTKRIMTYGFKTFFKKTIIEEKEMVRSILVFHGTQPKVSLGYSKSVLAVLKKEDQISIKVNVPESLEAPIAEGDQIGYAQIFINDIEYEQIPLIALESVERHDFFTSLEKIINNWLMLDKNGIIISES